MLDPDPMLRRAWELLLIHNLPIYTNQLPMYLESMLGKMAKDIPGLVEKMEASATPASSAEDMVSSLVLTVLLYHGRNQYVGSGSSPIRI